MSTKDIRTSDHSTTCDVCGRTLLRGETPEPYVAGGERRWVCDLCTSRALQEGWVREGTVPTYDRAEHARERRRPLLGFLRNRRPIDVVRQGRPEELLAAIRQEQADSYA